MRTVGVVSILTLVSSAAAQEPVAQRYLGAATCKQCHEQPGELAHPHVELTEFRTWTDRDLHSRAYRVLETEPSRRMAELLWGPDAKAHERVECLNCHSVTWPKELRGPSVRANEGVSCEACHGPASGWLSEHQFADWYDPSRTTLKKKTDHGMYPTWDAGKLAERCLACHLGNVTEGKFLTHEFYAAGHPPLPSFELVTFRAAMPPHWKTRPIKEGVVPDLEAVIAGATATFGESMRLLADAAERDRLADFANFDCAACHHDLERPSWRVERGYAGRPGRPRPRTWPMALMELGIGQSVGPAAARGPIEGWNDQVAALDRAFDARPFGDAVATASAARDLATTAIRMRDSRPTAAYDRAAAVAALRRLSEKGARESLDYDSARQIAWAFNAIYSRLDPKLADHADIDAILTTLRNDLALELPSARRTTIVDSLPKQLDAASSYDSKRFKEQSENLMRLLQ
jgi:hypothetical protein